MERSKFLAKVFGLYFVALSIVMFADMQSFLMHIKAMLNSESLIFAAGFSTLILGILLIVGHNRWVMGWPLVITLFGWMVALKGILLIIYPKWVYDLSLQYTQNQSLAHGTASTTLVLGLIFLFLGVKKDK